MPIQATRQSTRHHLGGIDMKTIDDIALAAAKEIYKDIRWGDHRTQTIAQIQVAITAAIHEAAAPQVVWANAVDWPDEPGLWLHDCGKLRWVFASRFHIQMTRENCIQVHADYGLVDKRGKFFGPMTPPLPAPPKPPSPWEYEPKDGDYVWVSCGDRPEPSPCFVHNWNGNLKIAGRNLIVAEMKARGYRFALAQVSPAPPEEA